MESPGKKGMVKCTIFMYPLLAKHLPTCYIHHLCSSHLSRQNLYCSWSWSWSYSKDLNMMGYCPSMRGYNTIFSVSYLPVISVLELGCFCCFWWQRHTLLLVAVYFFFKNLHKYLTIHLNEMYPCKYIESLASLLSVLDRF